MTTAHKLGMKIMFKPQIDLTSDPSHWRYIISPLFSSPPLFFRSFLLKSFYCRGNIGVNFTDAMWDEWFASYTELIVHYAELGEQNGVEVFSLGCELISTCMYII